MRDVPAAIIEALAGSASGSVLTCNAVYDGAVVPGGLEVSSWSLSWRSGAQQTVQGSASFTVQDPDGRLAPWGYDEPLSVAGSRIQAVFECAGETVPMGEWLITSNQPNESWRITGDGLRWVHGGATVPLDAADLTQLLEDESFMSPEAPERGGTVFSEIRRLCDGIMGVNFVGVTDVPAPRNMIYEGRLTAVIDLARMVGEYRVDGDGLLEVYNPERPVKPIWFIRPGEHGTLVSVNREQSRDGLYNAVVATGQTEGGKELREYATTKAGPLRFDGPMGRKPMDTTALADTQAGVLLDAQTTLANQVASATTYLDVHCAPTPEYEIGDWGCVVQPVIDGTVQPLIGKCVEINLSGGTEGLAAMKVTLECATADVLAVARYVRRTGL